ncbi:hypothetical protein [Sphingomonas oryzagri]|uniref:Uncharacterized protein n=1 Tax=Sphingomonas oryzagri TaxID=3042314 RepID=A0ABT6N611_9SPHN|nr:hypothetical protein [Sphingomonas oryzagri]MDH7640547.1 hypothetical protein [Sphingomonas oryzagri]
MPVSKDNIVRLADRRPVRTAQPIEPASLQRLYEGPRQRPRLIPLPLKPSRAKQIVDVAMIALIVLTIGYFAAEFARAYIAGRL